MYLFNIIFRDVEFPWLVHEPTGRPSAQEPTTMSSRRTRAVRFEDTAAAAGPLAAPPHLPTISTYSAETCRG